MKYTLYVDKIVVETCTVTVTAGSPDEAIDKVGKLAKNGEYDDKFDWAETGYEVQVEE